MADEDEDADDGDTSGEDDDSDNASEFDPIELELLKDEWRNKDHDDLDFHTRLLCGKWTKKHKGKLADACAYLARGKFVKEWCSYYGFPRSRAFYFSKYGTEEAHILADALVRRAQYFYDIYMAQEDDWYVFTPEDISGYEDTLEFVNWLLQQDQYGLAYLAAMEIRKLFPK